MRKVDQDIDLKSKQTKDQLLKILAEALILIFFAALCNKLCAWLVASMYVYSLPFCISVVLLFFSIAVQVPIGLSSTTFWYGK